MLSFWVLLLALVPVAVLLLAVSSLLPHQGRAHDTFQRLVSMILFCPVPGAPQVTFIKLVLVVLSLTAVFTGASVYNDGNRAALPPHADVATQLKYQAKGWRDQRNFYLTCLALSLWFMVFNVFTLKRQIARLLDERDAAATVAAGSSARQGGASKQGASAANVATAQPVEGVPVQRKMPQPSAPPAENAKHLD